MIFLDDKNILVVGFGKSGVAVADKASNLGANVWVYEDNFESRIKSKEPRSFKEFLYPENKTLHPHFDLVVTSPGIPFSHPVLKLAAKENWQVISEVEFAYRLFEPEFVVGVTGTNGKTTVVELLRHIFKLSKKPFTVAGNIGLPVSSLNEVEGPLILELSSFQLHFIDSLRVNIGAFLNISEDHLDWHCCYGQYLEDKLKLFSNQEKGDIALINRSVQSKAKIRTKGRIMTFGAEPDSDYSVKDGYVVAQNNKIIATEDILIKGRHNIENVLVAVACAKEAGVGVDIIREGLKTFKGLEHRIQFIAEKGGIKYYNDSKSTNPDSTETALKAFDKNIILIMGGRNKGNDFSILRKYLNKPIKELIIYGEAASEIKGQIETGLTCTNVEEALAEAEKHSCAGDIILFSPGCSSFDLFDGYAKRGEAFMNAVGVKNV